jgi:hypothetical protein
LNFISDLAVTCGSSTAEAQNAAPCGYTVYNQDLSAGIPGSRYVYLSYKTTTDIKSAITDIALEWFDSAQNGSYYWENGRCYSRILANLNSGISGSKWVYLSYTKGESSTPFWIQQISSIETPNSDPGTSEDYDFVCWRGTRNKADTNHLVPGPYIFLEYR